MPGTKKGGKAIDPAARTFTGLGYTNSCIREAWDRIERGGLSLFWKSSRQYAPDLLVTTGPLRLNDFSINWRARELSGRGARPRTVTNFTMEKEAGVEVRAQGNGLGQGC